MKAKVKDVETFWKIMSPPIKSDTIGVLLENRKFVEELKRRQAEGPVYLRIVPKNQIKNG